jgi:signal peptidase
MTGETSPRRAIRDVVRWSARLLVLTFALVVAAAIVVVVVLPRAVQGQAMSVLSGSMTPTIPVGAIVLVRPVDPGTLHVGDVATYQKEAGKDDYVTHRIVKIDRSTTPATFTFKGDANRGPDITPVVPGQIRGQVWFHVPYLGAIRDGLHGKGGLTLVATLLLAGYAISQLSGGFSDRRKKPASFSVDRPVVVAVVDKTTLVEDMHHSVADAAAAWSALVVQEDGETATLMLTPPPGGLAACVELLSLAVPRQLLVIEHGNLAGPGLHETTAAARPVPRKERDDAVL